MQANKAIRKNAAGILFSRGNIYTMSLGICLCIAAAIVPIILAGVISSFGYEAAESVSLTLDIVAILTFVIFLIFVTVPTLGSFFEMSYRLYRGQETHVAEVLSPFCAPRRYFRTLRVWLMLSLRMLVLVAIPLAAFGLTSITDMMFGDVELLMNLSSVVIWLFAAVAFCAAGFFMVSFFLAPYLVCQGYSGRRAMLMSAKLTAKKWGRIWKYLLGFSGLFALSLLTVGMLFVVYTAPVMIFAYFIYAEKMINDQSKNIERGNENEG